MKPQIYTALQFSAEFDGQREYATYHVAAASNADAISALHEDGVSGQLLFLANRDGHGHFSAVQQLSKTPAFTISEPDFERWLATATKPQLDDGETSPPAWVEVPHIPVMASHAKG